MGDLLWAGWFVLGTSAGIAAVGVSVWYSSRIWRCVGFARDRWERETCLLAPCLGVQNKKH